MANNTYVALDKKTTLSAVSSIEFTSIPQGYTDLVIVANVRYTSTNLGQGIGIRFNNDSSTNYSATVFEGDGATASSYRQTNGSNGILNAPANGSQTGFSPFVVSIMNYSNTTTRKVWISRNSGPTYVNAYAGTWRATPQAITSIQFIPSASAGNIESGSTFSLYGILAEGVSPTTKATGGTVYSDSTYYYHVFGASGTFTPTQSITADVLMVGGGGSGSTGKTGTYYGSGGGAGQVVAYTSQSLSTSNYTVTIGAGGAAIGGSTLDTNGNAGTSTSFTGLTSASGGGGGIVSTGTGGTSGNGYAGGSPSGAACGGGGGSGAVGVNAGSPAGGNGGVGTTSYSSWLSATGTGRLVSGSYYIAGGGAGSYPNGYGGYGGGGGDPLDYTAATQAGKVNTGSGGAGGNYSSVASGVGGSGLVIVRYSK